MPLLARRPAFSVPALPALTGKEIDAIDGRLSREDILEHPCFAGEMAPPCGAQGPSKTLLLRCSDSISRLKQISAHALVVPNPALPALRARFGRK